MRDSTGKSANGFQSLGLLKVALHLPHFSDIQKHTTDPHRTPLELILVKDDPAMHLKPASRSIWPGHSQILPEMSIAHGMKRRLQLAPDLQGRAASDKTLHLVYGGRAGTRLQTKKR